MTDHAAQHTSPRRPRSSFQGQTLPTDRVGAAAGAGRHGTLLRSPPPKPGRSSTRPARLANAQHQVAMGLYGVLVVHAELGDPHGSDTERSCCSARSTRRSTPATDHVRHAQVRDRSTSSSTARPYPAHRAAPDASRRQQRAAALRQRRHQLPLDERARRATSASSPTTATRCRTRTRSSPRPSDPARRTDADRARAGLRPPTGTKLIVFDGNLQLRNRNGDRPRDRRRQDVRRGDDVHRRRPTRRVAATPPVPLISGSHRWFRCREHDRSAT